MTGITEAIAALAGMKTIADGLISMRDESKVIETKLKLMEQIYEVRQSIDALQDQISTLKQANRDLQDANLELQKRIDAMDEYDLIELIGGVHVLATKPADGKPHKPPYLCQACHSNGKKSFLSFAQSTFGNSHFPATLNCQTNKGHQLELPGGTQPKEIGYAS